MAERVFLLQGNGSPENRGCEAILRSTVSILRDVFGACRFVHCPAYWPGIREYYEPDPDIQHVFPPTKWSPAWVAGHARRVLFRKIHEPSVLRIREPFEKYIPGALATLAVGGDNYSTDYGRPVNRFRANRLVFRCDKPLILWGASIGPFDKDPAFERVAAEELKKVTLICARESETISYLDSLGIRDNVREVSDPAFVLEAEPVTLSSTEEILLREKCLGLNFSPLMARYWQGEQSWHEHATECVRSLLEAFDFPIVLVPHVVFTGSNDHEFMRRIVENLPQFKDRLALIGAHYNCRQLKWIISNLSMFVGARTHSTIAALSSCVPAISIGYSMKARGINKDIFGHLDWLVRLDTLKPESLVEVVQELQGRSGEVRRYLTEMMPAYKERSKAGGKYVKEVVFA